MSISLLSLLVLLMTAAEANIVDKSGDTSAVIGSDVKLWCSTNENVYKIEWQKIGNSTYRFETPIRIYGEGTLDKRFQLRLNVTWHGNKSELQIKSSIREDAGTYECIDNEGFGDRAQLLLNLRRLEAYTIPYPVARTTVESTTTATDESAFNDEEHKGGTQFVALISVVAIITTLTIVILLTAFICVAPTKICIKVSYHSVRQLHPTTTDIEA